MKKLAACCPLLLAGCGTLASPAEIDDGLPHAKAGPFRPLRPGETDSSVTGHSAPIIAERERNRFRSPAALDVDGDPSTLPIWLYAVEGDEDASNIVRFVAEDGRSVSRRFEVVVSGADEGGAHAPSALRVDGEVWLYYGTPSGLARRKSSDGLSFGSPEPVTVSGMACVTRSDVTVVRMPSGRFHLFAAEGDILCEAVSDDGVAFTSVEGDGIVFRAADLPFTESLGLGHVTLDHPFAMTATSAEGRLVTRVYFTGTGEDGTSFLGLAARYGESGPLVSAVAPVLRGEGSPREPTVLTFANFSLVYFTRDSGGRDPFPALAAGVAPATVKLD